MEGTNIMQIDMGAALGILGTVSSVLVAAWVGLARITIANREKEIDRRIDDTNKQVTAIDARLHTEEKATIRQDGDVRLVQSTHTNLQNDVSEIKQTMVTKQELGHLSKTMDKILEKLDPRRFPSSGSSTYAQTDPTNKR